MRKYNISLISRTLQKPKQYRYRSLIAGKYGNVRCVKSPGDGSGVIAADAGIV
jgi:hypothetical protein